jgi:phosphate:Na+ symporter
MSVPNLIEVLGGLALLLYGIELMSDGLEQLAGKQIQLWLERMTNRPFKAAIFGFGATVALQSSSLLMVTMIGLINARLFTLEQAVSVMMGQEIGTTLTGQLMSLDLGKYLLGLLVVGYVLYEFGGGRRWRGFGQAMLGVGILFLSMETMKSGIAPLAQQPAVKSWLIAMGATPFLGIVAGMLLTAVIQASSATVGLTIALGLSNAITLPAAISIILGANIGTCFTGLFASLRSCVSARRASMSQIIINLFGVALFVPFITPFANLLARTSGNLGRQIANAHSVFNIAVSLILFPFVPLIVRLSKAIIPGQDEAPNRLTHYLDDNLLQVPSIALTQAGKEVLRTAKMVGEMLQWSRSALLETDEAAIQKVLEREQKEIDPLTREVEAYVDRLLRSHLNDSERQRCIQLKHLITDIERVGDITENLAQAGQERLREAIPFSQQAIDELIRLYALVCQVWDAAIKAVETGSKTTAQAVKDDEAKIDIMEWELRESHKVRLEQGICTPKGDILLVETLRNLERVGDHADNLGDSVLAG